MRLSLELIRDRMAAALECAPERPPAAACWTAERVAEYLRARLAAEPGEGEPE